MILAALDARERELGHTWNEIRDTWTLAVVPTVVGLSSTRGREVIRSLPQKFDSRTSTDEFAPEVVQACSTVDRR